MTTVERLALRRLWHRVFDPCPQFRAELGEDHAPVFEKFLSHAAQKNLPLDWTLHCDLLAWLVGLGQTPNVNVVEELLAASASRWAMQDMTLNQAIVISSSLQPGFAVRAHKAPSPLEEIGLDLIEWNEELRELTATFIQPGEAVKFLPGPKWELS